MSTHPQSIAEGPHCTLIQQREPELAAAHLERVSKLYGSFAAVRNVTLTLARNTSTVILGENGAGKSTLLRLLAGLAAPTQGKLEVFGQQPQQLRGRIAYMSHAPMLYDELSAAENLDYFAALHKVAGDCGCAASPEMALRAVALDPHLARAGGAVLAGHAAAGFAGTRACERPGTAAAG